jgi:hypothetical protein
MAMAVLATSTSAADLKPWKHVVIEPKGDAGFMLMVGERDFAEARDISGHRRSSIFLLSHDHQPNG